MKKGKFLLKPEGIFISFISRELSMSRTVMRNYLKDPESYGTRKCPGHQPKITNAARRWLFEKFLKDNQAQEICKNLRIYPSLQEEFVNFSMNRQNLVYRNRRSASVLTAKHRKKCVDWIKKKVTRIKEKWKAVVFSDEKKLARWLPVLLAWFKKKEAAVFKKSIWRRKCYGLGSFFCVWKGWFICDGRETKRCSIYQCVWKKGFSFMNRLDTNNVIFQQDNTAIHTSKLMKDWFQIKKHWCFGLVHCLQN